MTRSVRPRERTERLHRAASDRQAHISNEVGILRRGRLANIGENLGAVNRSDPSTDRIGLVPAGRTAGVSKRRVGSRAQRDRVFVARIDRPSNNGMQLTKAARCAPSPSAWGQSLRAAFAADPECCAGPRLPL